jgi:hypothetical protein
MKEGQHVELIGYNNSNVMKKSSMTRSNMLLQESNTKKKSLMN